MQLDGQLLITSTGEYREEASIPSCSHSAVDLLGRCSYLVVASIRVYCMKEQCVAMPTKPLQYHPLSLHISIATTKASTSLQSQMWVVVVQPTDEV